jgi:hypothetical protein
MLSNPASPPRPRAAELLRVILVAAAALLPGRPAALADSPQPSPAAIEFFEKQVRPILVEHCYECHAGKQNSGGLRLDSRAHWQAGGDSGAAIVPEDPDASRLITAVRYSDPDLQMPPQNRLDPALVAALEKWVALGAADPRDDPVGAGVEAGTAGMSLAEGREFWSFRPVGDPDVPMVKNTAWVRTPIDAFIASALEQNGLAPAPPADRRTLIRRLTFNLTGLPPTPAAVDAFLADPSPGAWERLIEQLLLSPEYGERWGRHWLDVARYADSNGLDENLAFGNAWRYRDYVVDAFNQDKPFDQFLIEQIAGDLIPGASRESKIATGFLVLGAKVLAEPDREKLEMDTIDEQIDVTGKVFLGMTLGCARCHDHKFDPLTQSDYYALGAIFKSTRTFGDTNTGAIKHWHEHQFASDEELLALKKLDDQIATKAAAASNFRNEAISKLRARARSQATEYLVAATQLEPDASLRQVQQVAEPAGLHPRILHHCRLHLLYHADDAVFARWHELQHQADDWAAAVERHYRGQFAEVDAALAEARQRDPQAKTLGDPRLEAARAALEDPAGFLAVPPKPEFAFDPETLARYHQLMEQARIFESQAMDAPAAMGVSDGTVQASLPIHIRGSHRNLGQAVAREFPAVMRTSSVGPIFPANQSGRLELARWMASTQHPLTARVYVNRIWRWHFGAGLVKSTENFGSLGDRPSHPELLDWLARWFMASGWSTKELHRLILSSNVYQMASTHPQEQACASVDAENRLLWKFRLQRLEPEQLRDAILATSGRLDQSLGGKTVPLRNRQFVFNHTSVDHTRYDSLRRAIYLPVIRNNLYTLFEQFDFPDPTMPTGDRNSTVVAPQALLLMNAELVMDSADQLAGELLETSASDASRVELAYARALGRSPSAAESQRAVRFIDQIAAVEPTGAATSDPRAVRQAWALFCQSLYACNEFLYLR